MMEVVKVSENIISPLGFSVEENYEAVMLGKSALRLYEGLWGLPFPFVASMLDDSLLDDEFRKCADVSRLPYGNFTRFEKAALLSAIKALESASVDTESARALFILSTTKGNVELLGGGSPSLARVRLASTASMISRYFRNPNQPIVVSNACISGLCAQIEAMRCIRSGHYDCCVVTGADVLSPFIVSGFNCLKALSDEPCRPFSANRKGLNLGEAAATVVYSASGSDSRQWRIASGAVRNDANHISGPSRTGDGSFAALDYAVRHSGRLPSDLAFLNVHGTATPYNDEMESVAIGRAGLEDVPVNALKGYFGHTLGAAGVLEVLLSMHSVEQGVILPTRGFDTLGVSVNLNVSDQPVETCKKSFAKLLSGFGGCNAAAVFTKSGKS